MAEYEEYLQGILLEYLRSECRVQIIGEASERKEQRVPVISFVCTVDGVGSQQLVEAVERRSAFGIRSGHMYSHRLLREVCGVADVEDGVVRVSFLHYNSGEDTLCLGLSYYVWCTLYSKMLTRTEAEVQGLVRVLQEALQEVASRA